MAFAAALSEHPVAAEAAGEVVGQLLDRIGPEPDLAILFVSAGHHRHVEELVATVRELLRPGCLLGATAESVLAGAREVEQELAVAMWAARLGEQVVPVRLEALGGAERLVVGLPAVAAGSDRVLVVLADPFTFPVDGVLEAAADAGGPRVIGGLASAARRPGDNRLVLDGDVHRDGAVGALLPEGVRLRTVVSQGCRPIGQPMTVTEAEGPIIAGLAGKPALERLAEAIEALDDDARAAAAAGLHVGRVIDEHKESFGRGDFLIRGVLGADRESRSIAVGDRIEVGSTVQFHVRDAVAADEDLRFLLAGVAARGALVFTCNGRGTRLFGAPDHDAAEIDAHVAGGATAGMACAGEIGPVGRRSFVHGFTASVLLFD